MPHPYLAERIMRTQYAMRSGEHLLDLLDRNDVQDTLGTTVLTLKRLTEDAYVPTVTEPIQIHNNDYLGQSNVAVSREPWDNDNVPMIAVRPGETLTRNPYFFLPTARQENNAKAVKTNLTFTQPEDQLRGLGDRFITECVRDEGKARKLLETTSLAADEHVTCQPITYRNILPLNKTVSTLRWRPLLVMQFDPQRPHAPLGALAQALIQAEQVLENPVYVTGGAGYEQAEQAWLAEAQTIGAHIASFACEQ